MENNRFDSVSYLLVRVVRAHRNMIDQRVQSLGLYRGQPPVLFALQDHDGMSNSEMAEFLSITPATLTNKIKRMEKADLVVRRRDPQDERISRIYITDKGKGLMNQLREIMLATEAMTLTGFSEKEINDIKLLLIRILDNIGEFEYPLKHSLPDFATMHSKKDKE